MADFLEKSTPMSTHVLPIRVPRRVNFLFKICMVNSVSVADASAQHRADWVNYYKVVHITNMPRIHAESLSFHDFNFAS